MSRCAASIYLLLVIVVNCSTIVCAEEDAAVSFDVVHVVVQTGSEPLAAYQVDVQASQGVRIVGIEGGEHPAFKKPPYYDPKAIQNNRVILAAYSTAAPDDLPRGAVRVATLHVMIEGDHTPHYQGQVMVAADAEGKPIKAKLNLRQPKGHGA